MTTQPRDLQTIWPKIRAAGGRDAFIQQELERRGFLVQRKPTDDMSKKELGEYKKTLKAKAAERRKLLKETWSAYFEHHLVHLGEGVFWNEESDWDKYDHPRAKERAQENDLPPFEKPLQLAKALDLSIGELRWMTFHRDAATSLHYDMFTIAKNNGKGERAIWAPRPKLKAAQRWILREIVERLPVHGAAHGFLSGRSIYTNAACHTDSSIVIKMDLKDFFPTVTFPRVRGVFRKAGYREQIATLLALLCTESPREVVAIDGETFYVSLGPRSLPQGAPTSPAITNTLSLKLDRRLTGLAASQGWRYTRYADDLTFSFPKGSTTEPLIGRLLGATKMIVADEGFALHPDKTRVMRTGCRQMVTGLIVNEKGSPRVPRKTRRMLRAAIHNIKQGKPYREDESLHTLLGYASYIYMTDRELGAKMLESLQDV